MAAMKKATDELEPEKAAAFYDDFLAAREAAIIAAVREACGVS